MFETEKAVQKVADLAVAAAEPKTIAVEGHTYSRDALTRVSPPAPRWPTAFTFHTLSGLVAYLTDNPDGIELDDEGLILTVEDADRVTLSSPVLGEQPEDRTRLVYATALPHKRDAFPFGQFVGLEDFIIKVNAAFEDTADRVKILKLAAGVRVEGEEELIDDGVSQRVKAKAGVAVMENVPVPNPVHLAPFRTFPEIQQPVSPFVFRLRRSPGGVTAALFEADGGAWRAGAAQAVLSYLDERIPDGVTLLG